MTPAPDRRAEEEWVPCTRAQGRAALAVLLVALTPWIVGIVALVWRIWPR